jgi:predicted dehydrogenase
VGGNRRGELIVTGQYRVALLGLGRIASGYGSPQDAAPYCHAGGISRTECVELVAVADLMESAHDSFRQKWGACFPKVRHYKSLTDMLEGSTPDILAVCIRGPHHFAAVREALKAGVKAIFLEKPPTLSLVEMDTLHADAAACGAIITVSYSRHWTPQLLRLETLVREGLIGRVETVIGFNGGAVLSYASHTTDLICQFAGYDPQTVQAYGARFPAAEVPEGFDAEPDLANIIVTFSSGVTGHQVGRRGEHGEFYVDVYGSEGMVRAGMYLPPRAWDVHRQPCDLSAYAWPNEASVFTVAYEQLADYLSTGSLPACSGDAFTAVHEIGFAAIESVLRGETIHLPNPYRQRRVFANG